MNIPYISNKIKEAIFGDEKELNIKDFKNGTVKLRLGGKDWLPLAKDLEEAGIVSIRGHRIKLEK